MKNGNSLNVLAIATLLAGSMFFVGCETMKTSSESGIKPAAAQPIARPVVRIKVGASAPFTDKAGNVWAPDSGFDGGTVVERDPSLAVAGTNDPTMYHSERYSETDFSYTIPVANGKYTVKLYFAETYEGISGEGQRIFSVDVNGQTVKDIDLFKKVGFAKVDVQTFNVDVKDGKIVVKLISQNVQNPFINAIEIIPS